MKDAVLIVIAVILVSPFILEAIFRTSTDSDNPRLTAYDVIAELAKHGVVITKFTGFDEDARVSRTAVDHMLSQIDGVDYTAKKAISAVFLRQYFSL